MSDYAPDPTATSFWPYDATVNDQLYSATLTLLGLTEQVMADDALPLSELLLDVAEHVCEISELDTCYALMIKADAVRLIATAAGFPARSSFSPGIAHMMTRIDRQPIDVQRGLVARAREHHLGPFLTSSNSRLMAALARTTIASQRAEEPLPKDSAPSPVQSSGVPTCPPHRPSSDGPPSASASPHRA
ncbi:hypothetical protein [Streptomyces aidingensis]|uniref:hypothetical protein n=1 Tax=Streptomyces aidingensis TaxID=910347 RepID=UPI0011149CD5|nr:hypothetical protein [Streptomyces aidingensis]